VSDRIPQSDSPSIEVQKKELEHDIAALMVEHEICADTARTMADPVTKVKLEAQKDTLLKQMQAKELKLKALERQSRDLNRQTLDFDEALPSIDFHKAREIIEKVIKTLQLDDGGAALILMQQRRAMEGDLLLRALKEVLRSGVTAPLWYEITLYPAVGGIDERTFLKLLGKYLGVEPSGNLDADVSTVSQVLCDSLRENSTVVIYLTNCDAVGSANQKVFMEWLLQTFWQSLVNQLSSVLDEWYARVIFIIAANRKLTADCREAACFCTVDSFDSQSILELPLESWTEDDIRFWLQDHFRLPRSERDQLAKQIYEESEGDPNQTRTALQEYFDKFLAFQME